MASLKKYHSEDFNYVFDRVSGNTAMWGKTYDDDPEVAPFNIILDFEITERCSGIGDRGPCKFCYKSNTANAGYVTPLSEAKEIIDAIPSGCTQIAFGVDAKLQSNPDWFEIFKYAREKDFIPNVTVADIDDETAEKLASVCGAVAVSRYDDKNFCYNSVEKLTKYIGKEGYTLQQVNIHHLVAEEVMGNVWETIEDIKTDKRLEKLNAIVFLSLKRKGRGESFHSVTYEKFAEIVQKCMSLGVNFGFDSCSAHKFLAAIKGTEHEKLSIYCEPCESSLLSFYINAKGEGFPCSFTEGTKGWETGIQIKGCKNFVEEVWNNSRIHVFRELLLSNKRHCPIYNI